MKKCLLERITALVARIGADHIAQAHLRSEMALCFSLHLSEWIAQKSRFITELGGTS
jgi:hypothetical protein